MFTLKKLPEIKINANLILFFTIPLFSLILTEYAARGSLLSVIKWPAEEPLQFLISLIFLYTIYIFLWANLNHKGAAALSYSLFWIVIAAITGCKRVILGTAFMPWDINVGANAAEIIGNINPVQLKFLYNPVFLLLVVIFIVIIIRIFMTKNKTYLPVKMCNILTVVCCVIVAAVVIMLPKISMADSAAICEKDGFVRGFMINAKLWNNLSDSEVVAANSSGGRATYKFSAGKATTDLEPNVIFIMSESFWDATLLPNVTFSEDPIPNFHSLEKESISGEMVTNTYGGSTCNVEFEVMTGFSMKYLPYQTSIYDSKIINRPMPSIPAYFKSHGYQTVAVHPWQETFYTRNDIYPLLGIDKFVSLEDMPDAKMKGGYPSDDTFADYVISEFNQAQKPVFMYNISMQNHWIYTKENKYPYFDIDVKSNKDLDKIESLALKNYIQGLHDADASLMKVIDYFETVKEPTVIIFFGDHLPSLTEEFGVYKKLGYLSDSLVGWDFREEGSGAVGNKFIQNQKIFKMPYLIWSNYQNDAEEGKTVSSNYFGVYALSKIGLELPPFYNFLLDYSNQMPVNRYFLSIDKSGMPFVDTPAVYSDYEDSYESIQNNILFGGQSDMDLFVVKEE